jgi:uncharacterized protein (DUF58 family)
MKRSPWADQSPVTVSSQGRLLIILSMAAVFFGIVTRNRDILLISVLIDTILLAGFRLFPYRGMEHLTVKREIQTDLQEGCYHVKVIISLCNKGTGSLFLSLRDKCPFPVREGECLIRLCLAPGGEEEFFYTFECIRAHHRFEDISVIVSDPLGVFEESHVIPLETDLTLLPPFKREKPISPHRIRTLSSPGTILSGKAGTGMDFLGIREYQSGDSLGKLDWRQTARHPHRFYTREFEEEKNGDFHLVLDGRTDILFPSDGSNLFDEMVKAAAAFAENLLKQGNRVSLAIAGSTTETVMPGYGKGQLYRMLSLLAGAEPGSSAPGLENIRIGRLTSRAVFIVISPFRDNDVYFYRKLKAKGYPVLLLCPEIETFLKRINPIPSSEAFRLFTLERELKLEYLKHLSVKVIPWKLELSPVPLLESAFRTMKKQGDLSC